MKLLDSSKQETEETLTVIQATEERKQLKEAKTIKSNVSISSSPSSATFSKTVSITASTATTTSISTSTVVKNTLVDSKPSPISSVNTSTPSSTENSYTIGDKKLFGRAEVVSTAKPKESSNKTDTISPSIENETTGGNSPSSSPPHDRKVKKPPPYHVAASMSKQAAAFSYDGNSQVIYF